MRLSHGGPAERLVGAVLVGGIDVDTRGGQLHLIISVTIATAGPPRCSIVASCCRNRNYPRIGGRIVHSFTVIARGGYYQDARLLRLTHGHRKIIRPRLAVHPQAHVDDVDVVGSCIVSIPALSPIDTVYHVTQVAGAVLVQHLHSVQIRVRSHSDHTLSVVLRGYDPRHVCAVAVVIIRSPVLPVASHLREGHVLTLHVVGQARMIQVYPRVQDRHVDAVTRRTPGCVGGGIRTNTLHPPCLLYTSDAADDLLCVDLGARRSI